MNLAISNIAWNPAQDEAVCALMQKHGFSGLEIAPTKVFVEQPYSHIEEAAAWSLGLREKYGFCVPSMQSIWYGRTERLFGADDERRTLLAYTKSAIDFAAAVGCGNLVFGCPKNRTMPEVMDKDEKEAMIAEIAVPFFHEIGDYAAQRNTAIGMEANPKIYGANFINTTSEAVAFVRRVDSAGLRLNLDVGTMIANGEACSVLGGNAPLISHVHISEPFLRKIEKHELHRELLVFLAAEQYGGFVSMEMSLQESLRDIEDVMEYVRKISAA